MNAIALKGRLIDRLPEVRGVYTEQFDLARLMWFKVGGPAEVAFEPADIDDLRYFMAECPRGVPLTVIGIGSNLLVRDGGIPGVVIRLGQGFGDIVIEDGTVSAGASAPAITVARAAQRSGLAGLEFLSGIPGSIGGALRMNAGAYEREMKDVVLRARAIDPAGVLNVLQIEALGYSYRHSDVPEDWIFVGADLRAAPGDAQRIAEKMSEIGAARTDTQPVRTQTGGSTFKNPPGQKAWELIDSAGCRALRHGGAQVSEQHCNFLINTGSATAADIEQLGETVRQRVRDACGVELEWEIRRIGTPAAGGTV
ncbi:MAG: UDP-N-acetylmuramate dehydrogenase [Alphaproteobacteria bacterium]|nr:UDP-N-acetylmuramate dehydrogenase [Alphaproteobacteria bacterium]